MSHCSGRRQVDTQQSHGMAVITAATGDQARLFPGSWNSVTVHLGLTPVCWPTALGCGSPRRAGDRPRSEEPGFKDKPSSLPNSVTVTAQTRAEPSVLSCPAQPSPSSREQEMQLRFRQSSPRQGKFQTQGLGFPQPSRQERLLGLRPPGDLQKSLGHAPSAHHVAKSLASWC